MSSAFDRLRAHDAGLSSVFPKHVVGELPMTEEYFRDILEELRDYGDLRTPPRHFPRLLMIALVFTARYDYRGAFWKAFQENLGLDEVDNSAWGSFFRKCIADFGLFSPPDHWMVNVFPVLYHAIIPESSKADFGIMVRSLMDAVDVRDLDDQALLAAVRSYELSPSLRAFVTSEDSAQVACDLIRQVSEDFRQLAISERASIDEGSIRGILLASVANASLAERKHFTLRDRLLVWRWDLGSGELGAYLTGNVTFDEPPLRLRLGSKSFELDCFRDYDGRWAISSRLIAVSLSHAGETGAIDFASGATETVRLGRAGSAPFFFRASGNFGTLVGFSDIESGTYAIASSDCIEVQQGQQEVRPLEHIPAPNVAGVQHAALYDLSQGQTIKIGEMTIVVRGRMRAAATLGQTSLWCLLADRGERIPVYASPPRVRFESPFSESTYRFIDRTTSRIVAAASFEGNESLRPALPEGSTYRATIQVAGKSSGASAVEFAVLPIRMLAQGDGGRGIVGSGFLSFGQSKTALSEVPTIVPSEFLFSSEPIRYEHNGSSFRIQYVGPRPTMWRFGDSHFSQTPLRCDTADALRGRPLQFRGTPGSPVALTDSVGRTWREAVGADGLLSISLSAFGGCESYDRLDIFLADTEAPLLCASIVTAPVAAYIHLGMEAGSGIGLTLGGQVALDRSVDRLTLTLERSRQPWIKPLKFELDGFARSWELHCEPAPAEYILTLAGEVDGRTVPVLDKDGIWTRVCGERYNTLDDIGAALDDALSGRNARLSRLVGQAAARVRTIDLCISAVELNFEKYAYTAQTIFSEVGCRMTIGELSALGKVPQETDNRLRQLAAVAGLPLAAGPQRVNSTLSQQPELDLGRSLDLDFLAFLNGVAGSASNVSQAAGVIDGFADDPAVDELKRTYATLLRITLADDLFPEINRLEGEMGGSTIHRARLEANNLIDRSGLALITLCELDSVKSLFSKCVSAVLSFAFASRLCQWQPPATSIPTASLLLSRWMYDRTLGPLSRLALARAETICSEMKERTTPNIC